MPMSIQLTRLFLSEKTALLLALFLLSGCATRMTAGVSNVASFTADPEIEILSRSIKGSRSGNNTYKFREEIKCMVPESLAQKRLSLAKTICVERDCKTIRNRRIASKKDNLMKISFKVDTAELSKRFTMTTSIFGNGSKVKTYSYKFRPKDCLKEACEE